MSIIQIDVNSVIIRQEKLKRAWKLTEDAASMLAYVKHSIAPEISDRNSIGTRLMQVETQIHELERNIRRISGAVENGVLQYQTTENRVRKLGSERGNISYKQVSSIDNRKTSALYFRNNMFDGKAVRKSLVAENYVNGEHVRQLFGDFHKATATLKPPTLDFREEVLARIALMDGTFMEKVDTLPETKGYLARSFEQVVFGNFSEEVTALGTIGQIGLGLCGLDAVADIRDIGADIYHVCEDEEVPWWQLALDVVALIPLVGAFKNVDEVVSLLKSADNVKYLDEGTELAENIGKKAINSMEQADGSVAGAVKRAEKIFEGSSDVFDDAVESTLKGGLDTLSTPSSKVLRQNLIEAGVEVPDYPNAAHHIVAGNSPKAAEARAILQKYGVDINDAANGTFLPTVKDVAEGAYHPSLHTNAYYDKINKLLSEATCKEDVLDILEFIGDELSSGTFMQ